MITTLKWGYRLMFICLTIGVILTFASGFGTNISITLIQTFISAGTAGMVATFISLLLLKTRETAT